MTRRRAPSACGVAIWQDRFVADHDYGRAVSDDRYWVALYAVLDCRASRGGVDRLRWPARFALRKTKERELRDRARSMTPDEIRRVMAFGLEAWVDERGIDSEREVRQVARTIERATGVNW